MQSLTISEHSNADLKKKLAEEQNARCSADSALEGPKRLAEDQRKRLRETTDQLTGAREQMAALKKQLKEAQRLKDQAEKARIEAEKARDEAEQKGYDLGVAETKETLRAEVPAVCRIYCSQTWDEALNRAGVEASSKLRKPENVFYSFAI